MDEFLKMVAKQLGIDDAQVRTATGGIMNFVREQIGETDFSEIASKLPGVQRLISESENAPDAGGGLLGSLTSLAGSLLGEKGGSLATIASIFAKSGISLEKSADFLTMLVDFLRNKLGSDVFETLVAKLPDLLGTKK